MPQSQLKLALHVCRSFVGKWRNCWCRLKDRK